MGADLASVINGDSVSDPAATARILVQFVNGGSLSTLIAPLPENVKSVMNSAVSAAATVSGGGATASEEGGHHVFMDISEGVDGLDPTERAVLDDFLGDVNERLRERLIQRLQVLV